MNETDLDIAEMLQKQDDDFKRVGGYAYPVSTIDGFTQYGMTLRDYFAGQALVGVIAQCANDSFSGKRPEQHFAFKAYEVADAMIEARG